MNPYNQCLCIIMQYSSIIANPKQYEGRVSDMNPVCNSCCLFLLFFLLLFNCDKTYSSRIALGDFEQLISLF